MFLFTVRSLYVAVAVVVVVVVVTVVVVRITSPLYVAVVVAVVAGDRVDATLSVSVIMRDKVLARKFPSLV